MNSNTIHLTLMLAALALPLGACGKTEETAPVETAAIEQSNATVTDTIDENPQFATLSGLLSEAGLAQTFDGSGDYTVLAPIDEAFAESEDAFAGMSDEQRRPILVSVLRDHILPGSLDPEAISEAIAEKGGPVEVATVGDATVTFAEGDNGLVARGADGIELDLGSPAFAARNGVVIPVSGFLKSFEPS